MFNNDPETTLRKAAENFRLEAAKGKASVPMTKSHLQMAAYFLFDDTRLAFLDETASDIDRVFGVDTENEEYFERAVRRIERLDAAQTGQGIAALVAARRLVEGCKSLPHDQRRSEARNLIKAVDTVMERIYSLGPVLRDASTAYVTRRPALR
ncbi:hypothetical protein HYN69_03600 [Gemmobacter aquarius]|uniref:Uncharacterized protein n=1 Tax=Paragemmobacter aquarius TaxID=2169400 RepID=A0A2S0UIR7_9RHOB|nr:hypothetical protein [Gemmobacter aquarius]AWB47706.1 hypothetical protein HYN69_03600 [Gemmobacter aquarius]